MNTLATLGARVALARTAAAVLGGYAFVWGFVTLCITALVLAGLSYDDAWMLAMILAMVIFLVVFIWAFAARSLLRVGLVLGGGGALMTAAAMLLEPVARGVV